MRHPFTKGAQEDVEMRQLAKNQEKTKIHRSYEKILHIYSYKLILCGDKLLCQRSD